jgi:formamidase
MAMRRACLNAMEYLSKFGYSKEQAYVILGCAPVEGRIGGVVDIPNACVSMAIPTDMFEFDIHPNAAGEACTPFELCLETFDAIDSANGLE